MVLTDGEGEEVQAQGGFVWKLVFLAEILGVVEDGALLWLLVLLLGGNGLMMPRQRYRLMRLRSGMPAGIDSVLSLL